MTDRELLELAAKAAGVSAYWSTDGTVQSRPMFVFLAGGKMGTMPYENEWNPLKNDADAFRLMAKLRLNIIQNAVGVNQDFVTATHSSNPWPAEVEQIDDEAMRPEAMRRAIVRAAAMIGEEMGREK